MTMIDINLPDAILSKPANERLSYLKQKTILHPMLKKARDKLVETIREPAGVELVFLFGPSGVGKTTLMRRVINSILLEEVANLEADPGYVPIFGTEAVAPQKGNFSWKDYFTVTLRALNDTLIDHRRVDGNRSERVSWDHHSPFDRRTVSTELQFALEKALRHRKVKALFVDEAHHMAIVSSGRKLSDQFQVIKGIANKSQTLHVLFGTYGLLPLRNLDAQLARRSVDIHFPRYRAHDNGELQEFRNCLLSFQEFLPFHKCPDLEKEHYEFCYQRTIGCVGVLKDWLTRAASSALKDGNGKILRLKHLEETALSIEKCKQLASEATAGERRLSEEEEGAYDLDVTLGLRTPRGSKSTTTKSNSLPASDRPKTKRIRPPGVRNPKRDPVGRE